MSVIPDFYKFPLPVTPPIQDTPLEDGWYILSTDDGRDNIGYLHDLEKIQVITVEGKTMTADYYLKQYLSVQSDDDYILFRAKVKLTRK